MSVCRFVKGMPRWRSRVRLIVRQSILPCPSVRPTTLIRSICVVFDVARQIHVRTMLRPAHYHILAMSTQGFCVRLRDYISPPYCAARKRRCFMDHGWGRWSGRSCCRLSRRLDRFLFSFAPHNQAFRPPPAPIPAAQPCGRIVSPLPIARHGGHHPPGLEVEQTISGFRTRRPTGQTTRG